MANSTIYCHKCGTACSADAKFCTSCGQVLAKSAEQPTPTPTPQQAAPQQAAPKQTTPKQTTPITSKLKDIPIPEKEKKSILFTGALILLSLILFIFSFCPIMSYETEYNGEPLTITYSVFDNVSLMFDSFNDLSSSDLRESDLYEEGEDINDELRDILEDYYDEDDDRFDYEDFIDDNEDLLSDLFKIQLRMAYQSEDYSTTYSDVWAGILGLLYFLLTLALLAASSLHLVFMLIKKNINLLRIAIILLCCVPASLLVLYYFSGIRFHSGNVDTGMTACAVLSLIFSLLAIAALVAFRVIKNFNQQTLISAGAGALSSLLVLCMLFVPVFSASVEGEFSGRSSKREVSLSLDSGFYETLTQDEFAEKMEDRLEDERYEKKTYATNKISNFFDYTKKEVESGDANSTNYEVASILFSINGGISSAGIFSFSMFIYLILALAAGAVLTLNLIQLTVGFYNKKILKIAMLASGASALVLLIMAIIAVIVVNSSISDFHIKNYSFGIGAGTILALIFAVAPIFLPDKRENDSTAVEVLYNLTAEETPAEETPAEEVPVTETTTAE